MAGHRSKVVYGLVLPFERSIARYKHRRFCGRLVAITGSCGKSTTTFLIGELLRTSATVQVGLYMNDERTALRATRKLRAPVDFVVQEVSGHEPGVIGQFLDTLPVDVAVVTAVGLDHLTTFRKPEAVALEKGNLVAGVGADGAACLNADDALVRAMAGRAKGRVVLFGVSSDADVRAENIEAQWPRRLSFDLLVNGRRLPVATRFIGRIMLTNILGALAVVHATGGDMDKAVARLAELEPLGERMAVVTGRDQHTYVVDVAKAPLWSVRRVVEDFQAWGPVRKIIVLGDVSDKGNEGGRKLRQVIRAAGESVDLVIGMGGACARAERVAQSQGSRVVAAHSFEEARKLLAAEPPSVVLLKSNSSFPLGDLVPAGD